MSTKIITVAAAGSVPTVSTGADYNKGAPLNAVEFDQNLINLRAAVDSIMPLDGSAVDSVAGKTGVVILDKSDVGLGSVDNTTDTAKPVSTLQASADAAILAAANAHSDALVVGLWDDRGSFNASVNTYPTTGGSGVSGAILKGDIWTIGTVATSGQLLGIPIGTTIRAVVDTPGQVVANWATAQSGIGYVPENSSNKNVSNGYAGLTSYKLNLKNALGTITSFFTTTATAVRTWTLPDKDGTIAMTGDQVAYSLLTGAPTSLPANGGNATTVGGRTIYASASSPSGGVDGDLWFQY